MSCEDWLLAASRYELGPVRSESLSRTLGELAAGAAESTGMADELGIYLDVRQSLRTLVRIVEEARPETVEDVLTQALVHEAVPRLWLLVRDLGWPKPNQPLGGLREAHLRRLQPELAAALRRRAAAAYDTAFDGGGLCDTSWRCLALSCARDVRCAGRQLATLGRPTAEDVGHVARKLGSGLVRAAGLAEAWRQLRHDRTLLHGRRGRGGGG